MPDAAIIQIADALVACLAAWDAGQAFEIDRNYDTETKLEEAGRLQLTIVPVTFIVDWETDDSLNLDCQLDVGIRWRFEGDAIDAQSGEVRRERIDELVKLEEDLVDYLGRNRRLAAFEPAVLQSITTRAMWISEHLRVFRQFTGIFRLTYGVPWNLFDET